MFINNKNKYLILLIFLSIGFAFLSTQLGSVGNTIVSKQSWNIHFENPTKVGGSVDATKLEIKNTTTVEFSVDLLKPKDTYEFTVDVVNDGTIDAMISGITATELTANQKKLFEYVITYDDGASLKEKQLLARGTTDKFKVVVRYKDDIVASDLSENSQTITIEFTVEYIQADNTAINRVNNSFISLYNQTTPGVLAVGDEVNIGDEHFHIVSEDTNKYVLLSKYNINVGDYMVPNVSYGIQDKNCLGAKIINMPSYCTVHYSYVNYWADGNGNLISTYGSSYPNNNIYDENYSNSSGVGYSVAYYVKEYSEMLEDEYGAIIMNRRLLTYQELIDIGCTEYNYNTKLGSCRNLPSTKSFVTTSVYWISSASVSTSILRILDYGDYNGRLINSNTAGTVQGVRPVIEISKQYL